MSTATPTAKKASGIAGSVETEQAAQRSPFARFTPQQISGAVPAVLFVVLFVVMISVQGQFSSSLLQTVLETTVPLMLVGFGQTLVILTRGIDLSVGGIFSLSTALIATKITSDGDMVVWIPLVILIGLGAGAINGLLIVRTRMQPFIVTLASWSVFSGLALLALPTEGGSVAPGLTSALSGSALVPKALILALVLVVVWIVLRRTRFGTAILSVGSSEAAAKLNDVPVDRTKIIVYALSGMFAALGALYYVAVLTFSGSPVAGDPFILQSVAAVVIGGTSLAGGRGSLIGTILGALSLSMIAQIVFFSGAESYWSQFVQGMLILGAVLLFAVVELVIRRRNPNATEEA
ncbi:MAG TPA: ABC transporter permease [Baekduia sp.]|jgi:ribose transport system permease protein|nr:ABC transporter permease [Baekduia sp.]